MKTKFVLYYNDPPNPLKVLGVFDTQTEASTSKLDIFNDLQARYKSKFDAMLDELRKERVENFKARVDLLRSYESERVLEVGKSLVVEEVPYGYAYPIELPEF